MQETYLSLKVCQRSPAEFHHIFPSVLGFLNEVRYMVFDDVLYHAGNGGEEQDKI